MDMIRIKSKQNGFRRAGVAHSDQWVEYPEGRFNAEQLAALQAEPMLTVEVVIPEKKDNSGSGSGDGQNGGELTSEPDPGSSEDQYGGELASMTVEQLKAEIEKYQPTAPLKGVKKADLIGILEAHREAALAKG
jgi:hypothetical protein